MSQTKYTLIYYSHRSEAALWDEYHLIISICKRADRVQSTISCNEAKLLRITRDIAHRMCFHAAARGEEQQLFKPLSNRRYARGILIIDLWLVQVIIAWSNNIAMMVYRQLSPFPSHVSSLVVAWGLVV